MPRQKHPHHKHVPDPVLEPEEVDGGSEYHVLYGEDSREHLLHEEGFENDRMRPWQTD